MRRSIPSATVLALAVAPLFAAQAFGQTPTFHLGIGIRENVGPAVAIGENAGGSGGTLETIGARPEGTVVPGKAIVADGTWQNFTFTFGTDTTYGFVNGNGILDGTRGALEQIAFQNTAGSTQKIIFQVDDIYNVIGGVPTLIENFETRTAPATNGLGPEVMFRVPRFSGSTQTFLSPDFNQGNVSTENPAPVVSPATENTKNFRFGFQFVNSSTSRYVRLTTNNSPTKPNPAIDYSAGNQITFQARAIVVTEVVGWNVDADGSWNTDSNWANNAIPNAIGAVARFGGAIAITAPRTVTIDTAPTVGQVAFTSPVSYTIAAAPGQGLVLNSAAGFDLSLSVEQGSHTISAPLALTNARRLSLDTQGAASVLRVTSPFLTATTDPLIAVNNDVVKQGAGTAEIVALRLAGAAANQNIGAVAISAGTLRILPNGTEASASRINSLSFTTAGTPALPVGKLDLTNNILVIDYDTSIPAPNTRPNPLATIRNRIVQGYAAGTWSGTGIISSTAALNSRYAIGYADAAVLGLTSAGTPTAVWNGVAIDTESTLVRYTLKGDTNLDGLVNFGDLLKLAQNYDGAYDPTTTPKLWHEGDSDYTGIVNFADLLSLAQNYGSAVVLSEGQIAQVGADFAADFALAQSLVPEPATLGLVAGGIALAGRRRARSC